MAEEKRKRIAIIASKGTLDMAYPPLVLASTAAAMDVEAAIFFTFYGMDIINKQKYRSLKVAPIGNPAMPSPVPMPNEVAIPCCRDLFKVVCATKIKLGPGLITPMIAAMAMGTINR